jgi:hypothetical protein
MGPGGYRYQTYLGSAYAAPSAVQAQLSTNLGGASDGFACVMFNFADLDNFDMLHVDQAQQRFKMSERSGGSWLSPDVTGWTLCSNISTASPNTIQLIQHVGSADVFSNRILPVTELDSDRDLRRFLGHLRDSLIPKQFCLLGHEA